MKFLKRFLLICVLLLILLVVAVLILRAGRNRLQKSLYPLRYTEYVEQYAEEYHLEPALVYAVIRSESNFDADAKSRSGALGLMQMMPDTFQWLQEKEDTSYSDEDLFRPEVNIRYGCRFLSMMIEKYRVVRTALCAYNAGSGTVDGWLGDSQYSADGKNLDYIPYKETRKYADKVMEGYETYKELYQL
ncbi:MAG: lytic transglycosylase domain-containing protein [Oscillospiraceae bacterium]|jgi:soluble lytic murein transglycosylase|nr:lytic transglycosylase domain-containing protein [Oscillospiraceae bacterium]